ncbi:MAG: RtcB family protein [Anaerolineae bacterium]|nr:RtcB family protein [Anaerolineae bacterium]
MVQKRDFKRLGPYLWEMPEGAREDMRVPARIYADEELFGLTFEDRSAEQLVNTATLPGIVGCALAMPDIHQGYGFPIGGVAATQLPSGVISPGGVGYDINCGVRLLTTHLDEEAIRPHLGSLMDALFREIPSGVGRGHRAALTQRQLDQVLERGASWAVAQGYGTREDLAHTEEAGSMEGGDAGAVSARAKARAKDQLGTLGSGNHFIEVGVVDEVYHSEAAERFGLAEGGVVLWIHSGSRALGHQVCTDSVRELQSAAARYDIRLPDRELACAPLDSPEGRRYFQAMVCAANYAWANRQMMTHLARIAFERVLAGKVQDVHLRMLYDVAHNIAKIEEHTVHGRRARVCVHRKGATRAFGPGSQAVPEEFRDLGQPVLIPGSMGSASYVLVGTEKAMQESFGSTCHGAGRTLSRHAAKRAVSGQELRQQLERLGITVRAGSLGGLAEEAPEAYKDVDRVVDIVHQAGLALKVARTRPIGVMKG